MVPQRPDITADKPGGMESPEYEAFEKCEGGGILVISSVGPWESVGGDIKFLRLKQLGIGGLDEETPEVALRTAVAYLRDCHGYCLVHGCPLDDASPDLESELAELVDDAED